MLNDVKQYSRICLAYGYTDLRFGIDGLARVVQDNFSLNPFRKDVLFLFCGRHTDRIKGLIWEGDGFLQEIGPSARVPERVPGGDASRTAARHTIPLRKISVILFF